MDRPGFAVVGPGRVGLRLAQRLEERGMSCVAVRGRRPVPLERRILRSAMWDTWDEPASWPAPPVLLVCVPDRDVRTVAGELARRTDLGSVSVLHTSGLLTAEALAPVRRAGAQVASWHPLQSFLPLDLGDVAWDGVACAVEGDPPAVAVGFEVATTLGLRPWRIQPGDKPLYHAAAAVAANLGYLLVGSASELLEEVGLRPTQEPHPLVPLLSTVVRAATSGAGLAGLTGPLARGDCETVTSHLAVLPEPLADAYRALARLVEEGRSEGHDDP